MVRQVESPEKTSVSSTNNESPAERAARLTAELQAEEQAAMAVIRKKRETVRKALEEAQLKAREEEEVKAWAQREAEEKLLEEAVERARAEAEASRWAQQEQEDAEFWGKSGNEETTNSDAKLPAALSANAHPEEDGDCQPEDVMDIDKGASPKKGKGKAKAVELEERVGAARCGVCVGRGSRCWVDPARVKKWKEMVACRVTHGRTPAGVACKECSSRKQRCFLPELSKERAAMKPSSKRRRDEEEQAGEDREDGPRALGSGTKADGAGEGGDEAPKKKQRVEVVIPPRLKKDAPWAVQKEGPDYLLALVNINNSVASLARAVTALNIHLATIARYVEVMAGVGSDLDESDDESEELLLGDEEVACGLKKVTVNTWLDNDWYLKQK